MDRARCCVSDADRVVAAAAKALAHPARLAILRTIARKERCNCSEICCELPYAQSTVSQHLKVLRDAGLVALRPDGPNSRYTIETAAVSRFAGDLRRLVDGLCGCARDRADATTGKSSAKA